MFVAYCRHCRSTLVAMIEVAVRGRVLSTWLIGFSSPPDGACYTRGHFNFIDRQVTHVCHVIHFELQLSPEGACFFPFSHLFCIKMIKWMLMCRNRDETILYLIHWC